MRRADVGSAPTERARITTLDNGLTVISEAMPHLYTVALGVWVRAGARHEDAREHGLSHLLEHMAFKGTSRRSAAEIAEAIEAVGGDLNAATTTEATAYYVRVLRDDLEVAVDVLADIVLNPVFDADELRREKDVILQEIAAIQDSPDDLIYDLMQEMAYPDQALGRPIIGTPQTVQAMTRDDLWGYRGRNYVARNMVLSAAGAVDHDALVALANRWFGDLEPGSSHAEATPTYHGGAGALGLDFEQSHVLVAMPSPSFCESSYFAAQVFSGALGGGMSSRLFQEARERQGLCYSIYSSAWGLADAGLLMIHAATSEDRLEQLINVICETTGEAYARGFGASEIDRAKAQLKAGLMMSLESPSARADQMARQYMVFGRLKSAPELLNAVEAVSSEEILRCAHECVRRGRPSVAVVGAGPKSRDIASAAADRFERALPA